MTGDGTIPKSAFKVNSDQYISDFFLLELPYQRFACLL
jgi:hypothetical protein